MTTTNRFLFPIVSLPTFNQVIEIDGIGNVVFTGCGEKCLIPDDASSLGHPFAAGHDGCTGCYCYYREATEAEVSEAQAKSAAAMTASEASRELHRLRIRFDRDGEKPASVEPLTGKRLLMDQYKDHFVIEGDIIWHLRRERNDDSMVLNATIGDLYFEASSLPRTIELETQIMSLRDVLSRK